MPLMSKLNITQLPQIGQQQHWSQLSGCARSLAIASFLTQNQKTCLIITPDTLTANQLEQELGFFGDFVINQNLLPFPDWETLPYDEFSPHEDIISQRLMTLFRLPNLKQGVIIVPINTLLQRIAPKTFVQQEAFLLKLGDTLIIDDMKARLTQAGYLHTSQVVSHGEFSLRGSIMDLFPMGASHPFRIELFDNEVESIRTFDPDSQRSLEKTNAIELLPAREFPLTQQGISRFRQAFRAQFENTPTHVPVYQSITQGSCPAGIEYYLPLFFEQTQTLFDYLPENSLILMMGNLNKDIAQFWQEIKERFELRRHDVERPLLNPQQVFIPENELFGKLKTFPLIRCHQTDNEQNTAIAFPCTPLPTLTLESRKASPLHHLESYMQKKPYRLLFCAESAGRREVLTELLRKIAITPEPMDTFQAFVQSEEKYGICIGPLAQGVELPEDNIAIISETELFGEQVLQQRRCKGKTTDPDAVIKNLTELHIGDPIVHIEHGVGRYLGLQNLSVQGQEREFLLIEYANEAKLYVPVASLHLVNRYTGVDAEHAPLNHLGSDHWQKAKRKAAEKARDVAAELLAIYAKREARQGFPFVYPEEDYQQFAAEFPFEPTPDQQRAIDETLQDMRLKNPMDRLVCGDVGFGKTEVALRAAFAAVQSGKQVALLVPTTLLAQQHFQNFSDRFAKWPVHVEMLSRFRTSKAQTDILKKLLSGNIDILIGTHKLIQPSIKFNNLGLVIIDEEHRFGVNQKEQLKKLRSEVDILTLTATPIPRTLNMAMSGIRDLSIIATPPEKRLSVKTFIREYQQTTVREAVLRETLRGGQVFFLHNKVENIARIAEELAELIPEASIQVAHGQMRETQLERIMSDFYHRRFNVLVCTTIIETGIDIPTANTIIINRADQFGLAQLHQLRGRVGRSHHQAYAYLLTPPRKALNSVAQKRLEAFESLGDLGIGFTLATHDMEIRGAGELLGDDQSGNMHAIGFSLYMELLDRAVRSLQQGETFDISKDSRNHCEIDLPIPTLIPEKYINDIHTRLILYKRIANAETENALEDLQVELIDRFGLLPEATKTLFIVTSLKLKAQRLGIKKIDSSAKGGRIEFHPEPNVSPEKLIKLIQNPKENLRLEGPDKIKFTLSEESALLKVQRLLDTLKA